ncbi:uncharacterized protein TM35_000791050 [Trypanosoma theileri]|uniref:Uncharacterized protein n=1 Tax=Trypanosoma theileri TaxID=67003 RepID=A0A1X0NGS9_9TRYP|nr:uncharacterized protein TM35_000791050 [Trypanosoma theileri]ORC82979.1 hypothetical protein TM35_000791050 [Trypanosoma theileri]
MTSAISPLRNSVVELPWKALIAAAQPYQTLSGPALSVNFLQQPNLLPFQRLPFHHSGVYGRYFHSLLHSLAEFATTPRPVRNSHVKMLHAPKEDFWKSVGVLNSVYHTTYTPFVHQHPVMGAVELTSPSHRRKKDVRLSLYNSTHQPIATMIATGSSSDVYVEEEEKNIEVPLPHCDLDETVPAAEVVSSIKRLMDGSIMQQILFKNKVDQGVGGDVVPPWRIDGCVAEFCQMLALNEFLAPHVSSKDSHMWTIAAQQTVSYGELFLDEPVDLVSASPRVFAQYRMPPWRHRIGLPLFSIDVQPLCVALRLEVRQHGTTKITGTYFLVDVAAHL